MDDIIRRVQLKELEILKIFQDICGRHNLRYFAIGGTCIGAVRHKGFIPWDDDIDVAMPYEDFVKFIALAENELPEKYGIMHYTHSKHYTLNYFIRVHDKSTSFIQSYFREYTDRYEGIFIDVYPVHGLPKSEFATKIVMAKAHFFKKCNYKLRFPISTCPSLHGKIFWLTMSPLKLFLPYYYFTLKQEKMMSKYPFGCSDKVIFPWRREKPYEGSKKRNIFMYEDFKDTLEVPFEDGTIRIPAGYDSYLRSDFGDYMSLPPEEERISHHSEGTIIDFDRPYTYYIAEKEAGRL